MQYATAIGCQLTSNSWGGGNFSQALLDAIAAAGAANQLFIAAAGNYGSDDDAADFYPASYDSPCILSVAATDHNDQLASFSNYGATTVDLGAPGVDILSCQPGGLYQLLSGTSMATPHVAGVAALLYGRFPALAASMVKNRILTFVDPLPALAGRCVTGGRLNAMLATADPDSIAPAAIADLAAAVPGSTTMGLTWTATGDDSTSGRAVRTELRYSTAPIDEANWSSATLFPSPPPEVAGTPQSVEVSGLAYNTAYFFAMKAIDEWETVGPLSNLGLGTTLGAPGAATTSLPLESLLTGEQADQTLTLINTGEGTLDFSIPAPLLVFKATLGPSPSPGRPTLDLPKGAADPRTGAPVLAGSGGPDGFGYRWRDSDDPAGPTFAWVELDSVGTTLGFSGDDQNLGPFPLGFEFPYYGSTFTQVRVCSNGWLSFTSTATAFSNEPLPTGGTTYPENLVAPFWDDLAFAGGGQAYSHFDGTRFIVEWKDVRHFSYGGPYSFEAILYPNGKIVFQYLAMNAPLNEATVGIQDGSRTTGLEVVFNAPYLHDNLAVQFIPLAQWLRVTPNAGRVAAGNSTDVTVHYDATGMADGLYEGVVRLVTNAPSSIADVPAQMHVTGAPDIAADTTAVAFGLVYTGQSAIRTFAVANAGTAPLHVSGITSDDAALGADPAAFTVPLGGSQTVTLTYAPAVSAALAATVTVASDDPDEPLVTLAAEGIGNEAPDAVANYASMGARLVSNAVETQVLRLTNVAALEAAPLHFDVVSSVQKAGLTVAPVPSLDLAKGAPDPRPGMPALLGQGGPDAGGYRWRDSDEPGGPAFAWIDIEAIGTPMDFSLGSRDEGNAPNIPLGFSFPFYGNHFTTVNVCTNGWVSFTSTSTSYSNQPLPTSSSYPENLLAAFWDDLDLRTTGDVFTWGDGTVLVIQWTAVPHYGTTPPVGPYSFEILLYPSGNIVLQYLSMAEPLDSATIGIQDASRTAALQVAYNAASVHDSLAIAIGRTPEWLHVTPASGDVGGRQSADLQVTFDSAGLDLGTYQGLLHIVTNDPDAPALDIPVTLQVVSPTDAAAETLPVRCALSMLSANPARSTARFLLALPQPADVDLRVYNVRGEAVRILARERTAAGYHVVGWDGRADAGGPVAAGVYFVRLRAGSFAASLRVVLLR